MLLKATTIRIQWTIEQLESSYTYVINPHRLHLTSPTGALQLTSGLYTLACIPLF